MALKWLFLLACVTWDGAQGLSLDQHDAPAVIKSQIHRRERITNKIQKRTSDTSVSFDNPSPGFNPLYYLNLTVGTPPQEIQVELDTSSGYLDITGDNSTACDYMKCASGFFDVKASSSYQFSNANFNLTTTWEKSFNGDFGNDNVTINDMTISNMDLAVNTGLDWGNYLGLGYVVSETSDAPGTILQAMVDNQYIKSAAYSLWVEEAGTEGTILFGGVNKAKYTGNLYTMPIPAHSGIHYLPLVLVTGVTLQTSNISDSQTSGLPAYMVLDTMVAETFLPTDIVEHIYNDLNVTWEGNQQYGLIDCSMKQKDYNMTFTFSGFNLTIPLGDFISPGENTLCAFNIVPSLGETSVLGNTFLCKVYAVFDLSNNEISLAARDFDGGEDRILEIASGSTPISGAVTKSSTATATVPTAVISPSAVRQFPISSTTGSLTITSTSKGAASVPTGIPNNIVAGLIGAGLLIAL
ncbi:hypothetical protein N7456_002959 [Penicillium angulare]|uniref:Peptidase A1 domain-containing protein n=1 Tax=Penicillium angulare TaxID=116970 RepID=A0A9W9FTV7_9EURO|nr:hypothetical protein N7456_002959 [Penicillium angulare]